MLDAVLRGGRGRNRFKMVSLGTGGFGFVVQALVVRCARCGTGRKGN